MGSVVFLRVLARAGHDASRWIVVSGCVWHSLQLGSSLSQVVDECHYMQIYFFSHMYPTASHYIAAQS